MKKKILFAVLAAVLVTAGCAQKQVKVEYIGEEKAKAAALEAAGLQPGEVSFQAANLNERNGIDYYGVDFTAEGKEYSCDVDALTGKLIQINFSEEKSKPEELPPVSEEPIMIKDIQGEEAENTKPEKQQEGQQIGEEAAKTIALEHAGVKADQVKFVKTGLDRDDGFLVYDIEFYSNNYKEYDYDIDAYTGEILSFDHDAEYYERKAEVRGDSRTIPDNALTEEEAKQIALEQVPGASAENIREFEIDYDDGRLEYEGKIYFDHMEYEFEIDGYSGAIRNWEVESI